jgi:perosamine synthetase
MIPVNTPLLDGNELRYLKECIETGWISSEGAFVERFESAFAERVDRSHGIAVSNGTAALEVALTVLGISNGDEVILPGFTIISCANAVLRTGASPVFVDSQADTWNMDIGLIESRITANTRAIMAVHIYGLPVDMDPLLKLAQDHGLFVIEDAAQAHGLDYKNRPCGSFGDISTFSFYPNKLVTTGEGGMLVTDDENLAQKCRYFSNLCFQNQQRFIHKDIGFNYRMSNLQAAVGLAQLEQLDRFIEIKRQLGAFYTDQFRGVSGLQLPVVETPFAQNLFWVYGLVLEDTFPLDAKQMMFKLNANGIGTRPFFWPMHEQPVLVQMGYAKNRSLPVAERLARRGFYIPTGLGLSEDDSRAVSAAVLELMSESAD